MKFCRSHKALFVVLFLIAFTALVFMGLGFQSTHCHKWLRDFHPLRTASKKQSAREFEDSKGQAYEEPKSSISQEINSKQLKGCYEKLKAMEMQRNATSKQLHDIINRKDTEEEMNKNICKMSRTVSINVDNRTTFEGYSINGKLYVPFSFIRKHFEIYGNFIDADRTKFKWKHANLNIMKMPEKYSPTGTYIDVLGKYVARRKRVRCIDGVHGVPVSIQWDKKGYFYPIQIAQFGLVHYSKFYANGEVDDKLTFNVDEDTEGWQISDKSKVKITLDELLKKRVMEFDTREDSEGNGAVLEFRKLDRKQNIISIEIKTEQNVKITISVLGSNKKSYRINYVPGTSLISYNFPDVIYGVGDDKKWRTITRDLDVDLIKGLALQPSKASGGNMHQFFIKRIHSISINGHGKIGQIEFSSTSNVAMFMNAANWLLKFQDQDGGWKVNVTRKIFKGVESKPAWYSAMGQGQAISLLCRVYAFTKKNIYLDAARRAVKIFDLAVQDGGITSKVMGIYKFYEEYPTSPSMHVLNGFIFSLIGLYDLSQLDPTQKHAQKLYDEGLNTLLKILPLYDSGHGTYYDLRHIVMPTKKPNRARWDYHAVHIGQLKLLKKISPNNIISVILQRWIDYTVGIQAPHN